MTNKQKKTYLIHRRLIMCGMIIVGTAVGLWLQACKPFILFKVDGKSMTPTLNDGEYHIAVKVSGDDLNAGDIIVIYPDFLVYPIVKRVAAVAGDYVRIENGFVKVNGKPYLYRNSEQGDIFESEGERIVSDEVYLLGDNPYDSYDSRYFGAVETNGSIYRMIL